MLPEKIFIRKKKIIKKHLPIFTFYSIIVVLIDDSIGTIQMQKWRNWQTRTVQVRVVAIP